ncbi:CAAX prenyl protease [Saitoella coloradoensis]
MDNLEKIIGLATDPVLTPSQASLLSALHTALYVGILYIHPRSRPTPTLSKDSPQIIRLRALSVTVACLISTSLTAIYAKSRYEDLWHGGLRVLGFGEGTCGDVVRALGLVFVLYIGPLVKWLIWENGLRFVPRNVKENLTSWIGWRNYIIGPFTEELVFRACVIPLHLLAHESRTKIIFYTPLFFGLAHIHHFYEFRLTHSEVPVSVALFRTLFQFTYTTLFGWFASFVWLRTGSTWACVAVHTLCNVMGLPETGSELRGWKKTAYRAALVGGMVGFGMLLCPWTNGNRYELETLK